MRTNYRKYKGFSLIELLLTTMILAVIMLLVATTLNTVIKVSNTTNSKNTARANMEYLMDYISRALTNSELGDIYMFNSINVRVLGESGGQLAILPSGNIGNTYLDGKLGDVELEGNEIHIKLYGYNDWTCIGYFKDESGEYGYLVRTVYEDDMAGDHSVCFGENAVVTPMHSFMIDVPSFSLDYLVMGDQENRMFLINSTLRPLYWPVADTFPVNRDVTRQAVVSTQALTWY